MKKPKKKFVGSGITRREVYVTRTMYSERDGRLVLANAENDGDPALAARPYIDPISNFPAWIDATEEWVAKTLEHFKLPAPERHVAYLEGSPRSWRYENDTTTLGKHMRTEWYLQRAYPEQSSFWYLGCILYHIKQCRFAVEQGSLLRAAGHAMLLGRMDRELMLKFSGEKRLRDFERYDALHVAGTDKGNATNTKRRESWQSEAARIWASSLEIRQCRRGEWSAAADAILARWPDGLRKPSHGQLRKYVPDLAKRHVLPEPQEA